MKKNHNSIYQVQALYPFLVRDWNKFRIKFNLSEDRSATFCKNLGLCILDTKVQVRTYLLFYYYSVHTSEVNSLFICCRHLQANFAFSIPPAAYGLIFEHNYSNAEVQSVWVYVYIYIFSWENWLGRFYNRKQEHMCSIQAYLFISCKHMKKNLAPTWFSCSA